MGHTDIDKRQPVRVGKDYGLITLKDVLLTHMPTAPHVDLGGGRGHPAGEVAGRAPSIGYLSPFLFFGLVAKY
jgi:hypothetical protein